MPHALSAPSLGDVVSNGDPGPPRLTDLKVFVSYSRADLQFVDRLRQGLLSHEIEAFVDRSHIEKLVEWRARIEPRTHGEFPLRQLRNQLGAQPGCCRGGQS